LGLVGVVAIAARGSTPTGTSDSRPPADAFLDAILSIGLLLLLPAAAMLVYGLMQRKEIARERASRRYLHGGILLFVVVLLPFVVFVYWRLRDFERTPIDENVTDQIVPGGTTPEPLPGGTETAYKPEFSWVAVLVVLTLAGVGALAAYAASRRGPAVEASVAETLADALEDTLDDLRAETDPRRAVIAAYARLEHVLAAHGLPKRAAETPKEYLTRILPELEVERGSVRRLTDLFTRAKFSQHDVDSGMKEEAIDALSTVRDELRATAARRAAEHAEQALKTAEARP
jgi:hypothetical protein